MDNYLALAERVLHNGNIRPNRTTTPVRSTFGEKLIYDMRRGFPLITTKAVKFEKIIAELVAFLQGKTSAADFRELGTKIWDGNANENKEWLANPFRRGPDDLGPIYGYQWRKQDSVKLIALDDSDFQKRVDAYAADGYQYQGAFPAAPGAVYSGTVVVMYKQIDQLQEMIDQLRATPYSRRHIVTAWNPQVLAEQALPPCHSFFQCYARDEYLDMQMYQRSADLFLGVPFNIASYAALLHAIAMLTRRKPGILHMVFGDVHIYANHIEQIKTQLRRAPRGKPNLHVHYAASVDDLTPQHFELSNYRPCPAIPAPMANN